MGGRGANAISRITGTPAPMSTSELKQAQLEAVTTANPMLDDYHTGIRELDDIMTFDEAVADWGDDYSDDWTAEDQQAALQSGRVTVYHGGNGGIDTGVFVTPSYMTALQYAGMNPGKIYRKVVKLTDVAWIDVGEGQYAKVD